MKATIGEIIFYSIWGMLKATGFIFLIFYICMSFPIITAVMQFDPESRVAMYFFLPGTMVWLGFFAHELYKMGKEG